MAAISSLVHETTTTAGAGNQTLVAANARRRFSTAFGTGGTDVFYYGMLHRTVNEWEYGTGHMSAASTFVRDTIIASSNSNLVVTFSAGTIDVVCDMPAEYQLGGVTPIAFSTNDTSYSFGLDADGTPLTALTLGATNVNALFGHRFELGTTNLAALEVRSTSTGSAGGTIILNHDSSSPVAGDYPSQLNFWGRSSTGVALELGSVAHTYVTTTNNLEDTRTEFWVSDGGSEVVRLSVDGDGLKFNADTAAANALDDYEEGTFSPTLTTDSVNFTSVTYHANRAGLYTKIGKRVFISGYMTTTAVTKGSASGNVGMGGLPFTAASTAAGNSALTVVGSTAWLSQHPLEGEIASSSTFAYLYDRPVITGGSSTTVVADVGTGANANLFAFGGSYEIA